MDGLSLVALAFAAFMYIWVYRVWNRRHEDIREAQTDIQDLYARIQAVEKRMDSAVSND